MGLDRVGIEIYAIHEYFRGLTISQRSLGFWGVIVSITNDTKKKKTFKHTALIPIDGIYFRIIWIENFDITEIL